jgi:hypothetical protein
MLQRRSSAAARTLWLCLGCVLLTTLYAPVVLADNSGDSHLDDEAPPLASQAHQAKSRYAGWLLAAYLLPPAVAVTGLAAESGSVVIAGAALTWLAPTVVHLIAGEYALAGRASLMLAFAAAGCFVGGLVGLGVGAVIPEDQATREEDPGLQLVAGAAVGGVIGGLLGIGTWAVIDISEAFERDAKRRHWAHRIAFGVTPLPRGAAASVVATF